LHGLAQGAEPNGGPRPLLTEQPNRSHAPCALRDIEHTAGDYWHMSWREITRALNDGSLQSIELIAEVGSGVSEVTDGAIRLDCWWIRNIKRGADER
jgi:hypothetical protein